MKLQILSDLHLDFHADEGAEFLDSVPIVADIAVIAGDLCEYAGLEQHLIAVCRKWKRVIYVEGNHDCYGSTISETSKHLKNIADKVGNLIFLDNERVEIEGKGFVGGTMWFRNHRNTHKASFMMNDFRRIKFIMHEVYNENRAFLELHEQIQPDDVVVSHHLPYGLSVNPKYHGSPLNIFFLCEVGLDYMDGPKLWIHGHTHESCDYVIEKRDFGTSTRVVCNPAGYLGENKSFKKDLVVEV